MTIVELKAEANKSKKEGNLKETCKLWAAIWELEKNEWNGYYLAQCLRKIGDYEGARKLHSELGITYPDFKPLQNDKLWLDYSENVKDWDNPNLLSDAENILSRADRYDKYTSSVYTKTVLTVIKHLSYEKDFKLAYEWIQKLDQAVISNSVFSFNNIVYPADRKVYFIRYADILVQLNKHLEYIESCLANLNFVDQKITQFKKHILNEITFDDYISRVKLARVIKCFQEEFHNRLKAIPERNYRENKVTLVSDLSHYLFCPVSFAINESFKVDTNASWEKDEWLGEKELFIDRHRRFQITNSFKDVFDGCDIEINTQLQQDFESLFRSTIRVNNATNPKPTIYANKAGDLKGAPDYIMQDSSGIKFAITEKFSSIYSADSNTPFDSDLIKHYAFIDELVEAEISFGYLITWYWHLIDIQTEAGRQKKKIVIKSYRLTKVKADQSNSNKLKRTIQDVNDFKARKSMEVDGDRISFANKCLNCSVISYCSHKTGKFNVINLPYDLNINQVRGEPKIQLEKADIDDFSF